MSATRRPIYWYGGHCERYESERPIMTAEIEEWPLDRKLNTQDGRRELSFLFLRVNCVHLHTCIVSVNVLRATVTHRKIGVLLFLTRAAI